MTVCRVWVAIQVDTEAEQKARVGKPPADSEAQPVVALRERLLLGHLTRAAQYSARVELEGRFGPEPGGPTISHYRLAAPGAVLVIHVEPARSGVHAMLGPEHSPQPRLEPPPRPQLRQHQGTYLCGALGEGEVVERPS